MMLAEAVRMASLLGLHDDESSRHVNFLEREMRRRIFWLICEYHFFSRSS